MAQGQYNDANAVDQLPNCCSRSSLTASPHHYYQHHHQSQHTQYLTILSLAVIFCICTSVRNTVGVTRLTQIYSTYLSTAQEKPTVGDMFLPRTSSSDQQSAWTTAPRIHATNSSRVDGASRSAAATAITNSNISADDDEPRVCFVTAQFLTNLMHADRLMNPQTRSDLYQSPNKFQFLAFTNHPDFQPRGWKVLLRNFTNYRRDITKSRWPKFQGFNDPDIQSSCDVVFYFDGPCQVIGTKQDFWNVSQQLLQSDVGLAQSPHPKGGAVADEFVRILQDSKDIEQNVNASLRWMQAQPDYHTDIPIYQNKYFAYNPHSLQFQKVANFFWNRYSLELESWRDQPLWAYSMHHFQMQPLLLDNTTLIKDMPKHRGMNGHRYSAVEDGLDNASGHTNVTLNVANAELCFIHIGKSGGDRLRAQFANGKKTIYNPPKLPTLHLWREFQTQREVLTTHRMKRCDYIVVWVRDPIERAIAAYDMVFDPEFIEQVQATGSKKNLQYMRNLQKSLREYGDLNSLAEQLFVGGDAPASTKTAKNDDDVQFAFSSIQQIQYSIAWYFWSDRKSQPLQPTAGPFRPHSTHLSWLTYPDFLSRLVFVGANECYEQDEARFARLFGMDPSSLETPNDISNPGTKGGNSTSLSDLSPRAYSNLQRFFDEDYSVLRTLKSYGLLQCRTLLDKLAAYQ